MEPVIQEYKIKCLSLNTILTIPVRIFYLKNFRMSLKEYNFSFEEFDDTNDLDNQDSLLLLKAREISGNAYAPYSNFLVGAAARLTNGEIVTGTNQENASFPAGLCAERVLLAAINSLYPNIAIDTIAISYQNKNGKSDHPVSPCGICRQSLAEYENRTKHPIRLILAGIQGKVFIINHVSLLLPLSFSGDDLL
jgi:cytidine deaminase